MDQLFQQNIVQPPNKIEVWPVLPDSSHSAKSETNAPAISRVKRNLTISIVQFLRQEASDSQHSAERIEAIEAAVQFLELAFNLSDKDYAFQPSKPLLELFEDVEGSSDKDDEELSKPTAADIEKADRLKEEGNELVKESKFQEAVQKYNEAIKLNRDPIYFCNRAAAYCRLERNDLAILDCRTALALDPNYAKAYGRMGVALSCQERYEDAVEAYKKAVELDPNNESYKTNLSIAKIKLRQTQQATNAERTTPGFPGFGGFGELGGMGGLLNNPQVAQMAAQAMSDPNVQQMMSQMMGSFLGPNAAQNQEGGQNPGANPAANLGGLENLMRVGEQIAEAMSAQNPELVEQLRRFNRGPDNANGSEDGSTDERP